MTSSPSAQESRVAPHVVGVVPASGSSSRMGTPKGLLTLGGRTFIHRVVDALARGGCSRVVVVVRAGDEATSREARAAGAEVMENPEPGEGPITSLRLALEGLPGDVRWVVWLPLDHPRVRADTVRALVDAVRGATGDVGTKSGVHARTVPPVLALPSFRGERGHPAVFGRAIFDELLDPEVDGGARTVVHRHLDAGTALLVETDDAGVLVDVDTPEEYEALVRRATE